MDARKTPKIPPRSAFCRQRPFAYFLHFFLFFNFPKYHLSLLITRWWGRPRSSFATTSIVLDPTKLKLISSVNHIQYPSLFFSFLTLFFFNFIASTHPSSQMAFLFGLVVGLVVGLALIVGFVRSENARSKMRTELVSAYWFWCPTGFWFLFCLYVFFLLKNNLWVSGYYHCCICEDDCGGF